MRTAAALLLLAAGCASSGSSADSYRIAAGAGHGYLAIDDLKVRRSQDMVTKIDDASGPAAMLEFASESEGHVVLARLQYMRSKHELPGFLPDDATVQQYRVVCLLGPGPIGWDAVALRPVAGFGVGAIDIDFHTPFLRDMCRGMVDLDLGLEVELARHLTLGCMVTAGILGEPGHTAGTYAGGMVFGGLRF